MSVVVAFRDVLAAISKPAVAEQESDASGPQILAMRATYPVAHAGDTKPIQRTLPSRPTIVGAYRDGVVHLGVGKRFVSAFVPSCTYKAAQVVGELLIRVD